MVSVSGPLVAKNLKAFGQVTSRRTEVTARSRSNEPRPTSVSPAHLLVFGQPEPTPLRDSPMPGTFTPELIRRVIDELGGEYRECPSFVRVRKALHACTLVSKRWTAHSRTHLLRKVEINAGRHQPTIAPPASVLPYVKDLRIFYGCRPTRATSIADLLKALFATPIEYLGITGVEFVDERICVQEFIEVHSATLQTVELESCSLSASDVVSILLGRHHLKRLLLVDCRCESPPPPGQSLVADTPDPNASSEIVELELSITGGDPFEGSANTVTTIAQLPHRFSRLAIDHLIAGEETTEATNALIKANADVLSSLQVNFIAGMCIQVLKRKK